MSVLLCVVAALASGEGQGLTSKLEEYMQSQAAINGFSGSVLVAREGKTLLSKSYGRSVAKPGLPSQSVRRYRVGTIAMQFTDMAILQLEAKGRLGLKDPICKYIQPCPKSWEQITVFELMTHTSGIPDIPSNDSFRSKAPGTAWITNRIKQEPLRFKPGETLDSSYSEDELLHAVIEGVSGTNYATYLRRHLFAPLAMRDTGYGPERPINAESKVATPILPSDVGLSRGYSAGELYSTVQDLYRWDRGLKTDKVASTESLNEMFTPYRDGYGFGWMVQKHLDRKVATQGGGLRTYSSAMLRYPDDDACVIVLSRLEATDAQKVAEDLAAITFGAHYELPSKRQAIRIEPDKLDDYIGNFAIAAKSVFRITKDGDRLMVQNSGGPAIEIRPESETKFFVDGSDATIRFVKLPNGRVGELILQQGGRDIPARRID